jgi:hypothetical protein
MELLTNLANLDNHKLRHIISFQPFSCTGFISITVEHVWRYPKISWNYMVLLVNLVKHYAEDKNIKWDSRQQDLELHWCKMEQTIEIFLSQWISPIQFTMKTQEAQHKLRGGRNNTDYEKRAAHVVFLYQVHLIKVLAALVQCNFTILTEQHYRGLTRQSC